MVAVRLDSTFITTQYPRAKWIVLIICSFAIFTNIYCNNLVSIEQTLINDYHLSDLQYNLLFSVYSLPNIILPILGGLLIDRISSETCILLFLVLECFGQFCFALGTDLVSYNLMILGRILFGLGGGCLHVCTYTIIGIYFDGNYVAFAMGIRQSMARLGSSTNDLVTNIVYTKTNCMSCTLWIGFWGVILCLILTVIVLIYLMKKNATSQDIDLDIESIHVDYGSINPPSPNNHLPKRFKWTDITKLDATYWWLNLCVCIMFGVTIQWNNIANLQLQNNYHVTYNQVTDLLMLFFTLTGICGPIFGFMLDKIGRKCEMILFCGILFLLSHLMFYLQFLSNPTIPIIILAVGLALFPAAIFPGVALIVQKKCYGTAYGLITATSNTALTIYPIIVSVLTTSDYKSVELYFMSLSILSIFIGITLYIMDSRNGWRLSNSAVDASNIVHKNTMKQEHQSLTPINIEKI